MQSKQMRDDSLFMRNNFATTGKWGIPIVKGQDLPVGEISLVACSDTRANDNEENKKKGVHFSKKTKNWLLNSGGDFKTAVMLIGKVEKMHRLVGKKCKAEVRIWK